MRLEPRFILSVDGTDLSMRMRSRVKSVRMTDVAGEESDTINIVLIDKGDLAMPRRGAQIYFGVGWEYPGEVEGVFEVDTTTISGGGAKSWELSIAGKASQMRGTIKQQRTGEFEDKTIGDIVEEIAGRNGFAPAVAQKLAQMKVEFLGQTEESDMHLLTRLARRVGGTFSIKDKKLVLVEKGAGETASGEKIPAAQILGSDVIDFRASIVDRPVYGKIEATWLNPDTGVEEIVEKAAEAFGSSGAATFRIRTPFEDKEAAEAAAEARERELTSEGSSVSLEIIGKAGIVADGQIDVSELRQGIDGQWTVERVEHVLDDRGWITQVSGNRDKKDKEATASKEAGKGEKPAAGETSQQNTAKPAPQTPLTAQGWGGGTPGSWL